MEHNHNTINILIFYVCLCLQYKGALPKYTTSNQTSAQNADLFNTTDYDYFLVPETTRTKPLNKEILSKFEVLYPNTTKQYLEPDSSNSDVNTSYTFISEGLEGEVDGKTSSVPSAIELDPALPFEFDDELIGNRTTSEAPTPETSNVEVEDESMFQSDGYPQTGDIPILNRKIFRGTRVTIREHPYIANIRRLEMHYLVGSIISVNVIVTVAHPLVDVPISELTVITGENYSDRGVNSQTVILILFHESFDPNTLYSDIALIRVYEEMAIMTTCKSIGVIMYPDEDLNGLTAFVTGWGRCDFSGRDICLPRSSKFYPEELLDPMLRTVNFPITVPNFYCDGYRKHEVYLYNGMLCIGVAREEDITTPCMAVPGAPLVVSGRLVGMQSWGFGCGYQNDLPLVYTDLRAHAGWMAYNVAIWRKTPQSYLTILFKATRSVVLLRWLYSTREHFPKQHKHQDDSFQPQAVDKLLSELSSLPIDVRDSIYNHTFREPKKLIYEMYQRKHEYLLNITNVSSQVNATKIQHHAFINFSSYVVLDFDKRQKPSVTKEEELSDDDYYRDVEFPLNKYDIPDLYNYILIPTTTSKYDIDSNSFEWESKSKQLGVVKKYDTEDEPESTTDDPTSTISSEYEINDADEESDD